MTRVMIKCCFVMGSSLSGLPLTINFWCFDLQHPASVLSFPPHYCNPGDWDAGDASERREGVASSNPALLDGRSQHTTAVG